MRACTAAVVELTYNDAVAPDEKDIYRAEIEFVAAAAWAREVDALFAALDAARKLRRGATAAGGDGGGGASSSASSGGSAVADDDADTADGSFGLPPESGARATLGKLRALHGAAEAAAAVRDGDAGDDAARARLRAHPRLGRRAMVRAPSAEALFERTAPFVDSSNDAAAGALWPLVQRVRVAGPWDALAAGVRLIDAPGLHDDNAARDGVVKATLRAADGVLLVANIRRAVNDKTTKDALPLALREKLGARGRLGDVAVVVTQADVLNKSEVAANLGCG